MGTLQVYLFRYIEANKFQSIGYMPNVSLHIHIMAETTGVIFLKDVRGTT